MDSLVQAEAGVLFHLHIYDRLAEASGTQESSMAQFQQAANPASVLTWYGSPEYMSRKMTVLTLQL